MQNSFASITARTVRPSAASPYNKEQGLIMQAVEGILPEQYVYALAEITDSLNIVNYSKISNGRIRIYLKNKTLVDKITTENKFIKVNDIEIPIRPLKTRSKRLIISNACPEIPRALIEE